MIARLEVAPNSSALLKTLSTASAWLPVTDLDKQIQQLHRIDRLD